MTLHYSQLVKHAFNVSAILAFNASAEGFPLQLDSTRRPEETRMMGLSCREKSLMISLAVWIQYMNVTD